MPARLARLLRRLDRTLLHPVLTILFPARCFGCQAPLGPVQAHGACAACWAGLTPLRPPFCRLCGLPLPATTDLLGPASGRCAACLLSWPKLEGVRAAVIYDAMGRRFLLQAKLAGRREILPLLGGQLAEVLVRSGFAHGCTAVVPVPSDPWTLLRRGYNPAYEMARPAARMLGIPLLPRLLSRPLRGGGPSKRLGAADRRRAVHGAFRASCRARGERILLVDDVMTTGATLESCALALQSAGAHGIRAAIWARTPDPAMIRGSWPPSS